MESWILLRSISLQHPHFHFLVDLNHLVRITDKFIRQLTDVHQPVLVHSDIDKSAKAVILVTIPGSTTPGWRS